MSQNYRITCQGFGKDDPVEVQTASTLENAIAALRRSLHIDKDTPEALRWCLRNAAILGTEPVRLWAETSLGSWLSLDPEDAVDAISAPDGVAAFERRIAPTPALGGTLTFQLRMMGPDDRASKTTHDRLRSVFDAISATWRYPFPPGPSYCFGLWRTNAEPDCFSLSARLGSGVAAVPLPLPRAEKAFTSSHAEMMLHQELRNDLRIAS